MTKYRERKVAAQRAFNRLRDAYRAGGKTDADLMDDFGRMSR